MRALVRYYRWCYSIYLNLSFKFHQWKFVENLLYEIVLNAITEMNNQRKKNHNQGLFKRPMPMSLCILETVPFT